MHSVPRALNRRLPAATIFETLLGPGSDVGGSTYLERGALGDCWPHPATGRRSSEEAYVALHKLSQWLTYSLIEPFENAGNFRSADVHELTGLAEYRNGGLLVDRASRSPLLTALSKTYAVA